MAGRRALAGVVALLAAWVLSIPVASARDGERPLSPDLQSRMAGAHVPFVGNEGQVDARVAYYAPTFAGTLFVTRRGEIVHALASVRTETKRGRPRPTSGPRWSL